MMLQQLHCFVVSHGVSPKYTKFGVCSIFLFSACNTHYPHFQFGDYKLTVFYNMTQG